MALNLNGSTEYLERAYQSALNPSQFSVSLWARCSGGQFTYRSPLTCRDDFPGRGYLMYARDNNLWSFWIGNGTGTGGSGGSGWHVVDGPSVVLNVWVHLVGTFDGSTMRLYKDGAEVGTPDTLTLGQNTARPMRVGAGRTELTPRWYFPGDIEDVRIYARPLSLKEVAQIYNGKGLDSVRNALRLRLKMNEGAIGAIPSGIKDAGPDAYDFTVFNSPSFARGLLKGRRETA